MGTDVHHPWKSYKAVWPLGRAGLVCLVRAVVNLSVRAGPLSVCPSVPCLSSSVPCRCPSVLCLCLSLQSLCLSLPGLYLSGCPAIRAAFTTSAGGTNPQIGYVRPIVITLHYQPAQGSLFVQKYTTLNPRSATPNTSQPTQHNPWAAQAHTQPKHRTHFHITCGPSTCPCQRDR